MELKKRIEFIIEKEQLTAAMFADMIGVQRSSISHIVSGRNKPSLEFLQKILTSFPNYNTDWLVMGKGEPIETTDKIQSRSQINKQETHLPSDLFTNVNKSELISEVKEIPSATEVKIKEDNKEVEQEKITQNIQKEIEQIIICYTDKTFLSYKPAEN